MNVSRYVEWCMYVKKSNWENKVMWPFPVGTIQGKHQKEFVFALWVQDAWQQLQSATLHDMSMWFNVPASGSQLCFHGIRLIVVFNLGPWACLQSGLGTLGFDGLKQKVSDYKAKWSIWILVAKHFQKCLWINIRTPKTGWVYPLHIE